MGRSSYYHPDTIALHSGYVPESDHGARAVPIYQTTSYVFDSVDDASSLFNVEQGGHIYSRISNPTVAVLEQRLAALEGGSGAIAKPALIGVILSCPANIIADGAVTSPTASTPPQ